MSQQILLFSSVLVQMSHLSEDLYEDNDLFEEFVRQYEDKGDLECPSTSVGTISGDFENVQ